MTFTFTVEKREGTLKDEELCMGVVYGPKQESTSLQFNRKAFKKLHDEAGSTNIIALEGLGEPIDVTITKLDRAPFTNEVRHVEFYAMERGVEMTADVPLVQVGEAQAANLQAIINQSIHNVSISCRPKDLIQEITVDMSLLKDFGDSITVADLKVPKGITINLAPEAVIISVTQAQEEKKEEEAEETPDAADVPVAGKEDASEESSE